MERPTCLTCPHWSGDPSSAGFNDAGNCLLYPPVLVMTQEEASRSYERGHWASEWAQPKTMNQDSCGQHPDFPAYLASLKASADRA